MSLRQRGQRPSEATNEGGYANYGGQQQQPSAYGSSTGNNNNNNNISGNNQHQPRTPQQPRPSPPTSTGSGYGGGGYYNAGYAPAAAPSIPAAAGGYGGYQATTATATTPAAGPPSSAGVYPNTAPPAYNNYNRQPVAGAGVAPRAMNFEQSAGGYGNNNTSSGGYGGYNANNNAAAAGGGMTGGGASSSSSSNPYSQKSKSASGFGWKHVLMSLMALTLMVLTGTTVYFRGVMKATESQLNDMREALDKQQTRGQKTGGRFDRGRQQQQQQQQRNPPPVPKGLPDNNNNNNNSPQSKLLQEEKTKVEAQIAQLTLQITNHKASHADLTAQHHDRRSELESLEEESQHLLKLIDHAKYELEDRAAETKKYKAMVDGSEEVEEYMKTREGALFERIGVLEGWIGRESWREVVEWFGAGPHRVEMEIEYPKVDNPEADPSTWPRTRNKITIEVAPLELMPHTANLFLQQVHHQLWDGCSFVSNPQHIFQVGPSYSNEERDADPHFDRFAELGLAKVSYQEYSKEYPHAQWTVGFAGRPSGPDFYINKLDNALIHGPGGQTNTDDMHNEADPCFGKVVGGLDVLEEIGRVPTDPQLSYRIKYPVVIIRARVLALKDNPEDGWREIGTGEKVDGQDGIMPLPKVAHGV